MNFTGWKPVPPFRLPLITLRMVRSGHPDRKGTGRDGFETWVAIVHRDRSVVSIVRWIAEKAGERSPDSGVPYHNNYHAKNRQRDACPD